MGGAGQIHVVGLNVETVPSKSRAILAHDAKRSASRVVRSANDRFPNASRGRSGSDGTTLAMMFGNPFGNGYSPSC